MARAFRYCDDSRLLGILGRSTRLMARNLVSRRIDAATVDAFLLENHLWGATKARYRYGLYTKADEQLVAVASFSARWNVRRGGALRRAARLARADSILLAAREAPGRCWRISKLLKAFQRDADPDEIVTVIDRDWGAGDGWATLGFQPLKRLPPVTFTSGRMDALPPRRRTQPAQTTAAGGRARGAAIRF